mmetsp:Transcript_105988/g.242678  ORF Transcript_105988/g.242678 Transcript_105988/m.242678 type:complete len:230 (-) Transcript_105988:366-1055(-)
MSKLMMQAMVLTNQGFSVIIFNKATTILSARSGACGSLLISTTILAGTPAAFNSRATCSTSRSLGGRHPEISGVWTISANVRVVTAPALASLCLPFSNSRRVVSSSWFSTRCPSNVMEMSHSQWVIPAAQACSKAGRVFSTGRSVSSRVEWNPRWATSRRRLASGTQSFSLRSSCTSRASRALGSFRFTTGARCRCSPSVQAWVASTLSCLFGRAFSRSVRTRPDREAA